MKTQITNTDQTEKTMSFNLIERKRPPFIHEFFRVSNSIETCVKYQQLEVARNYVNLFLSKWEEKMGERFSSFVRQEFEEQISQKGKQLQQLILP